ncbi:MAG: leucine-rich repeat domain-containing protein [Lachnospiraceae bacterium]|nr:leucine-rich repeat domain-containing protein [Lachnospiraceae bacterium]
MRDEWEYMELSRGARILKAWGENSCLEVPGELGGLPVTEIGPYAFSAATLPRRFQVEETKKRRAVTDGHGGQPMAGTCLLSIRLPSTVQVIGDYAFYGCRELREIAFTDSLERIGSGAFMGCSGVDRLEFLETGLGDRGLYQMLSELRYAMEIVIRRQGGETALVVPEYYESSVENIPARILELHYQGTGYRYRQCFRDGTVDYRAYDGLFGLAESQEPPEVLAQLAYDRLRYPVGLSDGARRAYLEWFSANVREAGKYFLKRDDLEAIRLICEAGGFDGTAKRRGGRGEESRKIVADGAGDFYMASMGEHVLGEAESGQGADRAEKDFGYGDGSEASLDVLAEMAGRMGRAEIVSCLMDYRHRKLGGGRKKVFEL